MRYDGIIFDFDGTLADTSEGVLESLVYALDKLGVPVPPREKLNGFIGPALFLSFQNIIGLSPADAEKAVAFYREIYLPQNVYHCKLYDGMKELLGELKAAGFKLAVASAKPQSPLDIVTKHLGIDGCFDRIVGADPQVKSNDKEELVRRALVGEKPVMVGDAVFDVRAAKATGIASVAAAYGFTARETLQKENPDFIADSVKELKEILLNS